ncbi:hypothetical protein Hanom_Chr16g01423011 [Helianthus anomalus]
MMWHSRKIHSHLDLLILISLHSSDTAYQISGRNLFQVGDDVTTHIFKSLSSISLCSSRKREAKLANLIESTDLLYPNILNCKAY